ncbi:MAG: host attachment protein [Myxococcales bacterium]|nr:host attachment protein [Myxococcales bacterium]
MPLTWIVVADAATARLFESRRAGARWQLLKELSNPEGRAKSRDFLSEPTGGLQKEEGSTFRGAMQPLSIKKVEAQRFARLLAEALDKGLAENRYERLVLVAAPEFLGMLREALPPPVAKRVLSDIAKDFSHADARELERRVGESHHV